METTPTIEYKKIGDKTLEVTNTPAVPVVITYNIDDLEEQKIAIEKQRDDFVSLREIELAEVNTLILEFNKL